MARLATSLATLRNEVNDYAPGRSKSRDGWIGNAAHAARASRHNPNDAGVVCALDLTNDPAGGFNVHLYARLLVENVRSGKIVLPDFEYVISNKMVANRQRDWVWRDYVVPKGGDDHILHAHFAVGRGPDSEPTPPYDSTLSWYVKSLLDHNSPEEEEDMSVAEIITITSGPESGKYYFIQGNSREYIDNPDELNSLIAAGLKIRTLNAQAWHFYINATGLGALGLRSIPPGQYESLAKA